MSSHIIGKVLSPAVRLWLRSQVEAVEELQFQIEGGDQQLLSGHIPKVTIMARNVIYQGVALSFVQASGEAIRVNLRQVLKGMPLRLMDVVPMGAEVVLHQTDLDTSLQTPLVVNAVNDLLMTWLLMSAADFPLSLQAQLHHPQFSLGMPQIRLSDPHLQFTAVVQSDAEPLSLLIRAIPHLSADSRIHLHQPEWSLAATDHWLPLSRLQGYAIQLGSDVVIQHLQLQETQMICRGRIHIIP